MVLQTAKKRSWSAPLGLTWRFWLALTICLVVSSLVWVNAFYTLRASIPPFEQLQRSEGILAVERISVRGGDRTLLRKSDGTVEIFSCRNRDGSQHTCFVDTRQQWVGKKAIIWWFPMAIYPWHTDQHVVQMVVEGKIVISPEKMKRRFESSKSFSIGLSLFMFVAIVVLIIFEYHKARRSHAAEHR